jgi:hypothetical protein
VHVADAATVAPPGSDVDLEARRRYVVFFCFSEREGEGSVYDLRSRAMALPARSSPHQPYRLIVGILRG